MVAGRDARLAVGRLSGGAHAGRGRHHGRQLRPSVRGPRTTEGVHSYCSTVCIASHLKQYIDGWILPVPLASFMSGSVLKSY